MLARGDPRAASSRQIGRQSHPFARLALSGWAALKSRSSLGALFYLLRQPIAFW